MVEIIEGASIVSKLFPGDVLLKSKQYVQCTHNIIVMPLFIIPGSVVVNINGEQVNLAGLGTQFPLS